MKLSIFCPFGLKAPIHASKIGFWGYFTPKMGSNINKKPQEAYLRVVAVLAVINNMSLSATVSEKSRGNKKCDEEEEEEERHIFWPFWHRCKMAATWLYATLLISIYSFCRGQHAGVNILSNPLFFRFSGVAKNRP